MCFTFLTLHEVETSVCLFVCFDFMLLFYLHFFTFQLCICIYSTTAHSNTGAVGLLSPLGMAYFDRMELLDVHHVVRHTLHVWALKPIYRP